MKIPTSDDFPAFEKGTVWLVGAGPGDPKLITLLGFYALQQADVIVHDSLVNRDLFEFKADGAELINAGKRGGRPSAKQRDISLTLVQKAREGRKVLRLKGGDPFIFGRGWEEMTTLIQNQIGFKIVPGITAAIAASAYSNIPITHRDMSSSVSFVTGHGVSGDVPDNINWDALSKASEVLVFYMAHKTISHIKEKLIAAGKSVVEPVALIANASLPTQKIVTGTLQDIDNLATQVEPPVIMIVGKTVALHAMEQNYRAYGS